MNKKIRFKNSPSQRYWVGAEIFIYKDKKEPHNVDAKLTKFGAKARQAQEWLKSFAPINTPDGDELKRILLRLPFGYRERKDVLEQYKKLGLTHENARFRMLSDHAGPANTLIYIQPTEQKEGGSNHNQPHDEQPATVPGAPDTAIPHPVVNEDGSQNEINQGEEAPVREDQTPMDENSPTQ